MRDEKGRFIKGHKFLGVLDKPNYFKKDHIPWNKDTKGVVKAWNKDKKLSKEHCKALSLAHIGKQGRKRKIRFCEYCKTEIIKCRGLKRKYCSHTCYSKAIIGIKRDSTYLQGKNNWNWKGGVSKNRPYKHYRNKEYLGWRKSVYERDNYTCQECGIRSGCGKSIYLHPHHKKSYTYFKQLRYELENGSTVCICCHRKIHSAKKEVQN